MSGRRIAATILLAVVAGMAEPVWVPFTPGGPEQPGQLQVLSTDAMRTVIQLTMYGFYREDTLVGNQQYQIISLNMDNSGFLSQEGSPEIPLVARLIAIPGDRAARVSVEPCDTATFGSYLVYPTERPIEGDSDPGEFVIDTTRYTTNEFYPDSWATASRAMIMRDFRVTQLCIQPVRHNPMTHQLKVARSMRVTLSYDQFDTVNIKTSVQLLPTQAFVPLYRQYIANYTPAAGEVAGALRGSYLIIAGDRFGADVARFAHWKMRKGWPVYALTTSQIYGNDSATVHGFIKSMYQQHGVAYVLLVGDAGDIACCHYPGRDRPSDFPYSLVEGDDLSPDLVVSRVCPQSGSEAGGILEKLRAYEANPALENPEWCSQACAVGGGSTFDANCRKIRKWLMDDGNGPFTQFDTLYGSKGLNTVQRLTDSLNDGRSWLVYRGHGHADRWLGLRPDFWVSDVHNLDNGDMQPIVIGTTCTSGAFDRPEECMADAFLIPQPMTTWRGAAGYFGSTRGSWTIYNNELAFGVFKGYVEDDLASFGVSTQLGQSYMLTKYPIKHARDTLVKKELYEYVTFGDGDLMPYSAYLGRLHLSGSASVPQGPSTFSVTVKDDNLRPVSNALVGISSDDEPDIQAGGYTDGNGQVSFDIDAQQPGAEIYVTGTKRNYCPDTKIAFVQQLFLKLGGLEPTLCCAGRDGYKVAARSGVSVDYAKRALVYRLPPLDSLRDYVLCITASHDREGTWVQDVRLGADSARPMAFATSVDTIRLHVPHRAYDSGGPVTLTITRRVGEYAAAASIEIQRVGHEEQIEGPQSRRSTIANHLRLEPCAPSPFNGSTSVVYQLPVGTEAAVGIYDASGKCVRTLVAGCSSQPGLHRVRWDGRDNAGLRLPSGVYFVRLLAGGAMLSRKVVVTR